MDGTTAAAGNGTGSGTRPGAWAGVAAGVPFLAVPPEGGQRAGAPIVLAWHLQAPPRTEAAFAAAVPLAGLDAWRVYLGLPMSGSRAPEGGDEEVMRLGMEDAVLNVQGPVATQAAAEAGPALDALRDRFGLGDGPLGLLGGSMGAAVALLVLAEGLLPARAAVLVSPLSDLRPFVDATAREFDFTYPWGEESLAVARRLAFPDRAEEVAARGEPAVRLVLGADDDRESFGDPAERLRAALTARYADPARVDLVTITGMGHALAEPPGDDPAPQTPQAAEVDRLAVDWFQRHLPVAG